MCGRHASTVSRSTLLETFGINDSTADGELEPDYNMAPTKSAPVVLSRIPKDNPGQPEPVRQLRNLRWGLVPSWARDPKIGSRMINARAETVHEKPSYRKAFAARRCIVAAAGFYEWFPTQELGKGGKPLKQPYFIHRADDEFLSLAGLYEFWRDPDRSPDDPESWLRTFTVITTESTDDVGHIHDRMPMTVAPERWDEWLDPRITDADRVRALMAPPEPGTLGTYPVTRAVNNVRSNGPQLLRPVEPKPAE